MYIYKSQQEISNIKKIYMMVLDKITYLCTQRNTALVNHFVVKSDKTNVAIFSVFIDLN